MRGEVVDAVLKKSYLIKRGHKMKTWKRRWFVLQKTTMRYYESKEKPVLKVSALYQPVNYRCYIFGDTCDSSKKATVI